jgi:hypothetical protein
MKFTAFVMLSVLLASFVSVAYAQQETRKVESITIPYTAANADRQNPAHFSFPSQHMGDWILTIRNELVYNSENPEAKVVVRLKEEAASESYVEVAMFSAVTHKFWLAVANKEIGYSVLYESENAWVEDRPVMVSYIQNDRLSVSNGIRNVADRLQIGPFILNTVEVYGKDSADAPANTFGGQLVFDVISGDPLENPIMMIPAVLAAAAGGIVLTLIKLKKRT